MGKTKVCYYQTSISNTREGFEFQSAIESQCYWMVEEVIEDRQFHAKEYLLRFESHAEREKFRKAYTSMRVQSARGFAASHCGWKDVPYISITKMPSIEEKCKTRKNRMTYKEAAEDILEYLKGQGEWMIGPYTIRQAAIELDSRVKHGS